MKKKLLKKLLIVLLLFMGMPDIDAHGVQVVYRELSNGYVRLYIEHWHGPLDFSMLSAADGMNITTMYGSNSSTADVAPSGVANNTPFASLPGTGTALTVLSSCAVEANSNNNWVYYDFAPAVCGVQITITLNYGLSATLQEACANLYPVSFSKTFVDVLPPVITSPDVIVDSCIPASAVYTASAIDACDGSPIITYDLPSSSIFPLGITPVTVTAEDNLGHRSSSIFNVVVGDISAPVANLVTLGDIKAECSVTSLVSPTATDNCSTATILVTNDAVFPITGEGTTTVVTWTYDDGNGNRSTQTQNVIINDITAPAPILLSGSVTLTPTPGSTSGWSPYVWSFVDPLPVGAVVVGIDIDYTAVDQGWGGTGLYSNLNVAGQYIGGGQLFHTANSFNLSYSGSVSAYNYGGTNSLEMYFVGWGGWRADWLSGTITIHYIYSQLPTILSECSVVSLVAPIPTDNCTADVIVTNNAVFPITAQGTTAVTWTYDDGNGNTSTQVQNVVINDVTAPVADVMILGDVIAECSVTSLVAPTATDNCSGIVSVSHNAVLPMTLQGSTVVTWTYDDGNGNTSTQVQNVVINDVTAPVADVTILADVTAECSVTSLVAPTASDNCSSNVMVSHNAVLPITLQGTTVVTWTYDDGNGNTSSQTQNVVIDDITLPSVLGQSITVALDATGNVTIAVADIDNGSTDNCGISRIELDKTAFTCANIGDNTVTLTVTDNSGNVSSKTAIVTVEDKVAPVVVTKNKTIQLNAAGTASIVLADINNGSSDACGITTLTLDKTTFTCANVGANTVILTVTDKNGNVATQTAIVTVEDKIAPVVFTKNITVQLDASSNVLVAAAAVNNGSTDNCGIALLELDKSLFSCADVGVNTVTLKVTDNSGNISYGTATITVVNSQPNLIRKHFDDVIFFDNSSNSFKAYSWYKNGVLVSGQTAQYFKDNGVLSGTYYAMATKVDGTVVTTCPLTFSPSVEVEYLKIAPNPVRSNSVYQLITNVEAAKLQNARVTVFNILGTLMIDTVVDNNTVEMVAPSVEGIYIVKLTLANGKYFTKNLLVKN
ncbi:T9SS type A sorting domain-containing protein [Flavobacterium frigoris]